MPPAYVLDTNTISFVLAKDEHVADRVQEAMRQNWILYLCPIVYFEIVRGFRHRPKPAKMSAFRGLMRALRWDEFTRQDWDRGARLWAECERVGRHAGDADVMIAAYALNRDATVVTDDVGHFEDIGLMIENWRQSEDSSPPRPQR